MDKRTYTEIAQSIDERLAVIETKSVYSENHLKNIDSHLDRLNSSQKEQDKAGAKRDIRIAKNTNNVGWIIKIGGGIITLITIPLLIWLIITVISGIF